MQVIKIYPRGFASNCYVLTENGKDGIVIDPAQKRVESELIKYGITPKYVLLTHCHFDHVSGAEALQNAGAKVLCSAVEKPLVGTHADLFDAFGAPRSLYRVDETFSDGETKTLCGIQVTALFTPGHTSGSCCYLVQDGEGKRYLFTGDTLFAGSIGRTDFPTGSGADMQASLARLKALDGDMPVYPGHEEDSTLETERRTNPFM